MPRLFVAVRPPPDVLDRLAALPRPVEPGVRWVPAEQWHVTVRFFGEAAIDDAAGALEGVVPALAGLAPVWAELGPRVSRLGRAVICVPTAGLADLAGVVVAATAGIGTPVDPRPFHGHVTLARVRNRGTCGLAGHAFGARFPVTRLELVRSQLGPRGARHEVVRELSFGP